jgi:hypothetical protein
MCIQLYSTAMKTISLKILLLALVWFCASCLSEKTTVSPSVPELLADGNWEVSWFWDKTKDETHEFNGYRISFESGGIMRVSGTNATQFTGNWSYSGSDDTPGTRLVLNIAGNKQMDELNDDWEVLEMKSSLIRLREDHTAEEEVIHLSRVR